MMNNLYKFTVLALFYQVTTGYTIGRVNNAEEGEKLSEERQDNCSQNDNTKMILLKIITAVIIAVFLLLLFKDLILKKCNKKEKLSQENLLEADNSSVTAPTSKEGLLTLPSNGRRQDKTEFKNEKLQETSELETIEKLSQENLLEAGNFSLMSSASDEYLLPLSSHGRRREDMIKLEYENYRKTLEIFQRKIEELQKANEEHRKEIERRKRQYKSDWRKAALYADWRKEEFLTVHVTLDADTAHPTLLLMAKGREVTCQEWCQDLPNTAQRFDTVPCVLGQSGITSGRCFWEVKVGDAGSWDLGICRDNVTRKGRVTMSPENGFWAIRLYEGEYWALTSPETPLPLREYPHNVGIFLDYEAGDISFYNMTDGSHIFTFPQNTFYGVLRPLFRLWPSDPATLTIV